VPTRVHNLSTRPFPAQATYGRRLVRLGAQLCDRSGALINRDFARAWLPETLSAGSISDVAIEIPASDRPGRYALKFDLGEVRGVGQVRRVTYFASSSKARIHSLDAA
jgi:hypothetical protein